MRRRRHWLLLAAVSVALAAPVLPVGAELVNLEARPHLDVNSTRFADSSLVDFSRHLSSSSTSAGFLAVDQDGHFCTPDGRRVRFWGINVAKDAVFQSHATIEAMADLFARTGFNLVRLHHIDDIDGLLPPARAGQPQRIDPAKLDAVDYWIAALGERGIWVYLDLLDYRTFWEEEGVANGSLLGRGAKPYAVFSDRLIELQIEYARQLLAEHTNPYTGLSYAEDPTVALVELCDENGLLASEDEWRRIMPPYRRELIQRWNGWLQDKYGTTEQLVAAWRSKDCPAPLAGFESLAAGTVSLPGMALAAPMSSGRRADARRFAARVHREYFQHMRQALRGMGVRVPISAVTDFEYPADLFAVASELDFVAANYYFAHPLFKPDRPGDVLAYFESGNPLVTRGPDTARRRLCGPRVAGKPLVIREWNICWPNQYRAEGILQAARCAAEQDVDGMILFSYGCQRDPGKLSYFDLSADPARWGLAALAGEMFRAANIKHDSTVCVVFSEADLWHSGDGTLVDEVYDLAAGACIVNWFPGCPRLAADRVYLRPGAHGRGAELLAQVTSGARPQVIDHLLRQIPVPRSYEQFAFLSGQETGSNSANAGSEQGILAVDSSRLDGTLAWCSLGGVVVGSAQAWVLKHVGRCRNTGQRSRRHFVKAGSSIYALLEGGIAPVLTGGRRAQQPLVVRLGGQDVLAIYQSGGIWELVRDGTQWFFYSDVPGVRLEIPALPQRVEVTTFTELTQETRIVTQPLTYPPETLMVRVCAARSEG